MVRLVFRTHNIDDITMYRLITVLNRRGFKMNPGAKGLTPKNTQNIVVDLQRKVYTPYSLKYIVFDKPSCGYFIEVED